MALSREHTSAKAKQFSLIQSSLIQHTYVFKKNPLDLFCILIWIKYSLIGTSQTIKLDFIHQDPCISRNKFNTVVKASKQQMHTGTEN